MSAAQSVPNDSIGIPLTAKYYGFSVTVVASDFMYTALMATA